MQGSKQGEGQLVFKSPKLPTGSQGRVFKCNIWDDSCSLRTFFWLVGGKLTGCCFGNLNHQPSCSNQCGVYMHGVPVIYLSRGVLVSAELKYMHQIIMYIPSEATSTLFYCWTIAFPLFLFSLTSLISNWWLSLLFGAQGRPRRLKPFFYKQEMEGLLYLGRPYKMLLCFDLPFSLILLNPEVNRMKQERE